MPLIFYANRRKRLRKLAANSAAIYGASWAKVSSPTLTRTDDAVGMVANAGLDGSTPANNFDTAEIYGEITQNTDASGNVFVRIPKFYIEKTDGVGSKTWRISKNNFGSAYLPWCFWNFDTNTALDYIDVGKYAAGYDGVSKLTSKSGEYPLVNQNIVTFRTRAQANGAGYQQLDIHVMDVLQTLFYVEFATLNSQAIMAGLTAGEYSASHTATATEASANRIVLSTANAALFDIGQTIGIGTSLGGNQIASNRTVTSKTVVDGSNTALNFDGAAVNVTTGNIVYSLGWKNGWSSAVAASSGSIGSNSSGRFPCMYRGIESPWGNVWQFVDGVNINDRQAWVCENAASYASNLFTSPYQQLGYVNHNADGYQTAQGWDSGHPYAALPAAVGGSTTTYYSDYYYQSTGQRIARVGGYWSYGASAGLSFWVLNFSSSSADVSVGGRLLRKAL